MINIRLGRVFEEKKVHGTNFNIKRSTLNNNFNFLKNKY